MGNETQGAQKNTETEIFSQAWSIDARNKIFSFRMCEPKQKPILVITIQLMEFAHCLNSYTLKHTHKETMGKPISRHSNSNGKMYR